MQSDRSGNQQMKETNGGNQDVQHDHITRLLDIRLGANILNDVGSLLQNRLEQISFDEISGSTGDLGTFLPLLLNMAAVETEDGIGTVVFSRALFWAGVMNIATGLLWNSPMPVQPMKTIAAVAITEKLSRNEVIGAGLSVSFIVFVLGLSGLVDTINYVTPLPLVRGLQVGLGLSMCVKGLDMLGEPAFGPQKGVDCILVGAVCFAFILFALTWSRKRLPAALIVVSFGFIIAVGTYVIEGDSSYEPKSPVAVSVTDLTLNDLLRGFWLAGFAQLPMTCLNSVVSVCDLNNRAYFAKESSKHISRKSAAIVVGAMNLLSNPFGAMPMCCGAGGLAAQYQFGARGGSSVMFLGTAKVLIAVIAGRTGTDLLAEYPQTILGVLLFFSGMGLATAGASKVCSGRTSARRRADDDGDENVRTELDEKRRHQELTIMLATAGATVALQTGWGCFFGLCFSIFFGGFDHIVADAKESERFDTLFQYFSRSSKRRRRSESRRRGSSSASETELERRDNGTFIRESEERSRSSESKGACKSASSSDCDV